LHFLYRASYRQLNPRGSCIGLVSDVPLALYEQSNGKSKGRSFVGERDGGCGWASFVGVLRLAALAQDDSKNKQRKKQIPSLRYGMTSQKGGMTSQTVE
jgi:hypothetical protein